MTKTKPQTNLAVASVAFALFAVACDDGGNNPKGGPVAQALYVAHEGFIASYDIATGAERAGTLPNATGPVDMQSFDDGHLMINLTGRNEVLIFDGKTMLEKTRLPSSSLGAMRPVHSYISPEIGGRSFWISFNDGADNMPATNSALFVDCKGRAPPTTRPWSEVALGVGHHKAAFSTTQARVVISNIADCADVLSVYDYSDPVGDHARRDAIGGGAGLGRLQLPEDVRCHVPERPAARAARLRHVEHDRQGVLQPDGLGRDHRRRRRRRDAHVQVAGHGRRRRRLHQGVARRPLHLLAAERSARGEHGSPGRHVPDRPARRHRRDGRDRRGAAAAAVQGRRLRRGPHRHGGGQQRGRSHPHQSRRQDAVRRRGWRLRRRGRDLRSGDHRRHHHARSPVLKPSLAVGQGTSHRADALSGDGKFVFVVNNVDGSVTQIDVATATVVKTIRTMATPQTIATWGTAEGAGEQTGPGH
jgi:YVTN family beta-propeller protein